MSSRVFIKMIVTASLLMPSLALSAQSALDATKAMIDAMIAAESRNEAEYKRIDKFIDYETITSATIEPHRSKFSDKQATEFKSNLRELIRMVAYPDSGKFSRESQHNYLAPKKKGDTTIVLDNVFDPKEDLELQIGYFWKQQKGDWVLVDLTFDEDSMIKDYQNQFGRIIEKEGVDGLMKKLDEKLAEKKK